MRGALWLGVSLLRTGQDAVLLRACRRTGRARSASPAWPAATCTCTSRRVARLQDALTAIRHRRAAARGRPAAVPQWRAASAHAARNWRGCIRRRCWPKAWPSPRAAISRSMNCATSIRARSCRRAHTPTSYLRQLAEEGAAERWPQGVPAAVRALIEKELAIIARAAIRALLPHGVRRGPLSRAAKASSARGAARRPTPSSATASRSPRWGRTSCSMLFERFVSKERDEPPDIDIDFEHERREEVIQYIYRKYGRDRAALAATVITYSARSVVRDLVRVLGDRRGAGAGAGPRPAWLAWASRRCRQAARGRRRSRRPGDRAAAASWPRRWWIFRGISRSMWAAS